MPSKKKSRLMTPADEERLRLASRIQKRVHEADDMPPALPLDTYPKATVEMMARQLDVDVSRVASELPALSRAAMWFRLMSGSLRRVPPSKRDITLKGIRQQAEKLGAKLIAANQAAHGLLTKLDAKRIGGDADKSPVSDLTVVLGLVADEDEVSDWMEMTRRISGAVSDATRVLTGRGRGNPSELKRATLLR